MAVSMSNLPGACRGRSILLALLAVLALAMPLRPAVADQPSILLLAVDPGALSAVVRDTLGRPAARQMRSAVRETQREVPEIEDLYGPDWVVVESLFPILTVLRAAAGTRAGLETVLDAINDRAPLRALALTPTFAGCATMRLSVDGPESVLVEPVASDHQDCASGDPARLGSMRYEF